jgi:hypothetical protein
MYGWMDGWMYGDFSVHTRLEGALAAFQAWCACCETSTFSSDMVPVNKVIGMHKGQEKTKVVRKDHSFHLSKSMRMTAG